MMLLLLFLFILLCFLFLCSCCSCSWCYPSCRSCSFWSCSCFSWFRMVLLLLSLFLPFLCLLLFLFSSVVFLTEVRFIFGFVLADICCYFVVVMLIMVTLECWISEMNLCLSLGRAGFINVTSVSEVQRNMSGQN